MEDPGHKLKRLRERLNLRYRDVEEASQKIADRHRNDEFVIALSRLADIENKGTVPTIYRLYSLCAIYRIDMAEVLEWYGVWLSKMPGDAAALDFEKTHPIGFSVNGRGDVMLPISLDPGIDLRKTTFLSRLIQRWGRLPLMLLDGIDLRDHRYAFIGTDDWNMYPMIQPGSLVLIDETKRKVVNSGWTNEFDRPIYLFEARDGWICSWCNVTDDRFILQPHPGSLCNPLVFEADELDVLGQVTGVAMRLDPAKRRRTR